MKGMGEKKPGLPGGATDKYGKGSVWKMCGRIRIRHSWVLMQILLVLGMYCYIDHT